MKTLSFISVLFILSLTSCQKKQYAFVQKAKVEVFVQKSQTPKIVSQETFAAPISEFTETAATEKNIAIESTIADKESLNSESASDDLSFNQDFINQEFAALNRVESFVNTNENVDVSKIEEMGLLNNIKLDTNTNTSILMDDKLPLNIPAFAWGCFLGWIGILIVYLTTEDKEQTKKALYGCLVSGGVVAVIYIVYIIVVVSALSASTR